MTTTDQSEPIMITLTRREAHALLLAWDIGEYPVTTPLGADAGDLLAAAEGKLKDALGPEWQAEQDQWESAASPS